MMQLVWFRNDLRLTDNPALQAAAGHGSILAVYIHDTVNAGDYTLGAASLWWLHHSLKSLDESLSGKLNLYQGDPAKVIALLIEQYGIGRVLWNRCYEPWQIKRDIAIKSTLNQHGIEVETFNGSLLWEPWDVKKADGTPYRVFTPFYRKGCLNAHPPRVPLPKPEDLTLIKDSKGSNPIESLQLLPSISWYRSFEPNWQIGEEGAIKALADFLAEGIMDYKEGRNYPAKRSVSRLSPHLHFGEISPNQAWFEVRMLGDSKNVEHFCSELGWREFSYSLLYYNPELPKANLQNKFDVFPWQASKNNLLAWQQGQTGVPIVDAGMRELWQTGYMHNRVRMIVGSFLVKNLLLHWHHGERWFWDCLLDADLANNSASWQWVAGCGADAAPYFRIFNPVTQGQKFDAQGEYTRHYVPELKAMPDKYLFNPWEAPKAVLVEAGVVLGVSYPKPIVDIKVSREQALEAFKSLR